MLQNRAGASGLEAVIGQGARRRTHHYISLIRAAVPGTLSAAGLAFAIYCLVMMGAGRGDWHNIVPVAIAMAAVPIVAVSLLIVAERRSHPFTLAVMVTVFATSLIVSLLAATRIPLSYQGIALTMPLTLLGVTIANIAMARSLTRRVGLLEFDGAVAVLDKLKGRVPLVTADTIGPDIRRVLIDPHYHHGPEWGPVLTRLYLRGLDIESWPSYVEGFTGRVDIDSFDLADVSYSPSQILYYRAKRAIDIAGVVVLAVPALLVGGLLWLYIRAIDGGPVLFIQDRRGYGGGTFRLYKFRTMVKNASTASTASNDARILPGCNIVRQLRLDELPQLVNILKGEMSFIGPRPVSVAIAESLEARIAQYPNRSILLPGLTGWAQVSHGYAETEDEEIAKLSYDLFYLKHVSLDLDVIIAVRTIKTLLFRSGAR
ncbi:Sugar transferase involved in LPS biosynthesis (colanic, teichoic acid) [Devosia crocina]|uniref:Sugar transferase involved in LPS biosynthesis (Colanic, teichoic acid) n=1 Tax=Devosia crocina TaxID=429728 RepID=A0A1I7MVP3_9HYPH|nr:sugar transferase [Devosia crocina]SFV26480.1 Sugar transferase involved in LPS biosynthesis (colanic, teichoic acid) [Devosia crocina]